jgi:hypothetical protein
MGRQVWIGALLVALLAGDRSVQAGPPCCEPPEQCFLKRLSPVGGWFPYSGGLLCWWNPHCFPCGGGPDDYCRKSLPAVCWPPYPPYFFWGPPQGCPPHANCQPAGKERQ